jgi:RHS repeat-associated protein
VPVPDNASTSFKKLEMEIPIPAGYANGYMYIYTNNESNYNVYFDEVCILHEKTNSTLQVTQLSDYYPFGLGFNVWNKESIKANRYLYQKQELQDDFGYDEYQYKYRMHDPAMCRFLSVDPLSEKYVYNSTYAFSENRVIDGIELEGLEYLNYSNSFHHSNSSSNSGSFAGVPWAYNYSYGYGASSSTNYSSATNGAYSTTYANTISSGYGYANGSYTIGGNTQSYYGGLSYRYSSSVPIKYEFAPGYLEGIGNAALNLARVANDGFKIAGAIEPIPASLQIGLINYRQSLSIGSKVGTFSNFSTAYRIIGYPSKLLGPAATYVGAPLSIGLDYLDPKVSTARFTYHSAGTLSSVFGGMAIGAEFGGPYGALGGFAIGLTFMGGEMAYDGAIWLWNQTMTNIYNFENGIKNGWYPRR